MVLPILGANTADDSYEISNSLRFNDDDSPELYRTLGSPTNNKIYTFSLWLKRSNFTTTTFIGHYDGSASNPFVTVQFQSSGKLRVEAYDNDTTSVMSLITNALFRDTAAWYHIVIAFDTTQGTASNRVNVYVNGNQVTSFSTETYPDQNKVLAFNKENTEAYYGVYKYGNSGSGGNFYDGYIAELHFIDGQQKAQTDFGEFNDNGVWIPIEYTGTYGNNGHFFEFKQTGTSANASGIGADTSGNDNHFTPSNLAALDVTEDTCTNNFATLIPTLNMTISEAGVRATTSRTSNWDGIHASVGLTTGKWYFETKASTSGTFRVKSGIVGDPELFPILYNGRGNTNDPLGVLSNTYPSYGKGVWLEHWYDQNYNSSSTASSQSSGDILQFALDLDNYKLWVGINGQFKDNSNNNVSYSDVASGNSATVTIASAAYTGKTFFPDIWLRDDSGSDDNVAEINFGNPSYSISSGNTDGKYGNFEYAVPSGFYAICSKRIAEFG